MAVHRPADVEKQQDLDGIVPLGPELDVQPPAPGSAVDRPIEVQLFGSALASEAAQAA